MYVQLCEAEPCLGWQHTVGRPAPCFLFPVFGGPTSAGIRPTKLCSLLPAFGGPHLSLRRPRTAPAVHRCRRGPAPGQRLPRCGTASRRSRCATFRGGGGGGVCMLRRCWGGIFMESVQRARSSRPISPATFPGSVAGVSHAPCASVSPSQSLAADRSGCDPHSCTLVAWRDCCAPLAPPPGLDRKTCQPPPPRVPSPELPPDAGAPSDRSHRTRETMPYAEPLARDHAIRRTARERGAVG